MVITSSSYGNIINIALVLIHAMMYYVRWFNILVFVLQATNMSINKI